MQVSEYWLIRYNLVYLKKTLIECVCTWSTMERGVFFRRVGIWYRTQLKVLFSFGIGNCEICLFLVCKDESLSESCTYSWNIQVTGSECICRQISELWVYINHVILEYSMTNELYYWFLKFGNAIPGVSPGQDRVIKMWQK